MHKGDLPVRVLSYNFLEWFENITPDFKDEAKAEIDFFNLKAGISCKIQRDRVIETARINEEHKIEIFENFNQYLWSICYSLIVLFDECYQKPKSTGGAIGIIDVDNGYVNDALAVFVNGTDLLRTFKDWQFFQLPNPEKYAECSKIYIEAANGVFTAAMAFILLHEYAHQFYGHLNYSPSSDESKRDELAADEYAVLKVDQNRNNKRWRTLVYGIVAGILSLLFLSDSLDGSESHPDIDDRLETALAKMSLDGDDNAWGISALALRLWAIKYEVKLDLSGFKGNYKEQFEKVLGELRLAKGKPIH